MSKKANVIYVVLDDLGFAQLGCYGSNIQTPNINKLAEEGLRYNNFHTTAICSATRASLLTGANHHAVGVSSLVEFNKNYNNRDGIINRKYGLISEILKENNYSTFAVGKWHLASLNETTAAGPYDNWPLGRGFDRYYGFLHAFTDQFNPNIVQDNTFVDLNKNENYHLSEDITDKAIRFIGEQKAINNNDKPFFLYLAYGAVHSPHQAPKEYIEKYKGKFDEGWDVLREKWFNRQKELGVIPQNSVLNERNEYVRAWKDLSAIEKKVYTKYMENFAGFLEHTDYQIGRLINYLKNINELDNTIVIFLSDNGASPEGGPQGKYNHVKSINLLDSDNNLEVSLENLDKIGSEESSPHYPIGWANLGNTPFNWYKTWVHSGGVKDPLIIRYPKAIEKPGRVVNEFLHVIDITPTVLDLLEIQKPKNIKGINQEDFHGKSFKETLIKEDIKLDKRVQYFEMLGNKGIYSGGYKAVLNKVKNQTEDEEKWELYNVDDDYSESKNIASNNLEKVKELINLWNDEAEKYNVLNHSNTSYMNKSTGLKKLLGNWYKEEPYEIYYENILKGLEITPGPLVDNRNHTILGEIYREDEKVQGVILAQGNRFGGNSIYIKNNRLYYTYNYNGEIEYTFNSKSLLDSGELNFELIFTKLQEGKAKVVIYINGKLELEGIIHKLSSHPAISIRFGKDTNASVSSEYKEKFDFDGDIKFIKYSLGSEKIDYEDKLESAYSLD